MLCTRLHESCDYLSAVGALDTSGQGTGGVTAKALYYWWSQKQVDPLLLVDALQRLINFFCIGLTAADEVSEKDCTVYNLNMESKECPVVA